MLLILRFKLKKSLQMYSHILQNQLNACTYIHCHMHFMRLNTDFFRHNYRKLDSYCDPMTKNLLYHSVNL